MLEEKIAEYYDDSESQPFEAYMDSWLDLKRPVLEKTTFETYSYRIRVAKNFFSTLGLHLADLKPEHIVKFYNHLITTETGVGKNKKIGYSNRSIRDFATTIKEALQDAVMLEYIKKIRHPM